jgi:hypothetical protein
MPTKTNQDAYKNPARHRSGSSMEVALHRYVGPIFVNGDFRLVLAHFKRDIKAVQLRKFRVSDENRSMLRTKRKEAEERRGAEERKRKAEEIKQQEQFRALLLNSIPKEEPRPRYINDIGIHGLSRNLPKVQSRNLPKVQKNRVDN